MDEQESAIAALGYRCHVSLEGAWRLTAPDGAVAAGTAPNGRAARRDAIFAAFTLSAMTRIRARR